MKVGDLVRIKRNRPVYQIAAIEPHRTTGEPLHYLEAKAQHPHAAKRVSDAWRWYTADELTPVDP